MPLTPKGYCDKLAPLKFAPLKSTGRNAPNAERLL